MISSDETEQPLRSRSLRSALFPLMIVVLLVYLASQTLFSSGDRPGDIAYGNAKRLIRESPSGIEHVTFRPNGQEMELTMTDGRELETNYPADASVVPLESLLDDAGVKYDATGTGESGWWSVATYLLPFALFFGFWIFLMRRRGDVKRLRRDTEGDVDAP